MWRTWWQRRSAQAVDDTFVPDGGQADIEAAICPLAVETAANPFEIDCEPPQATLDMRALRYSEPLVPYVTDEALTMQAVPTDADVAHLFALDDTNESSAADWHSDGWWLPPPSRHSVVRVPKSDLDVSAAHAPLCGIDRIALLHDLRGRFDPDQVMGLLATNR